VRRNSRVNLGLTSGTVRYGPKCLNVTGVQ
jgi:hypothetical protein